MSQSILQAAALLRRALTGFEPGVFSASDCARLAEELAAIEKACAAARLLAAARAVGAGEFREHGFEDGASWLARHSGSTGSQARQALQTARSLEECPDTKAALLAGEISLAQAGEITQAQSETPGTEAELLTVARTGDLSQLRDQAREHRQARTDPAELRRQQFEAREFRHWRDRLGMVRYAGALPPETGLPLVRRVELAALRARRAAPRAPAERERFDAFAADALAGLVAASSGPHQHSAYPELVLVCDLFARRRGHAHPGEVCQIIGGGPIPTEVAKQLAQDPFLKAVLHDGVNIHTVTHFGRHLPAVLRTALDLGPVPEFNGRKCVDCGRRWGLQYDHVNPVANRGPTEYGNLAARCWTDHQAKTERDRQAGLLGPHAPPAPNTS
jgi:5-methylcytosine-specific restriction endonuclease McrA